MIRETTKQINRRIRHTTTRPKLLRNGTCEPTLRLLRVVSAKRLRQGIESLLSGPRCAPASDKKSKDKYGMQFLRDAENEMAGDSVPNETELFKKLGISEPDKYPHLSSVLGNLKKEQKADALTFLGRIGGRHGSDNLETICKSLGEFSTTCKDENRRDTVVQDCLHDLAYPSDIDQRSRGTCGPTAAQMMLALHRPQEYTRLLTKLAAGKSVKMKGGKWLSPNTVNYENGDDKRSLSCKILQDSFSKFAGCKNVDQGTTTMGMQPLMRQLYGTNRMQADTFIGHSGKDMWKYMEDDLAQGWPVMVGFKGHWVLAVGMDKTGKDQRVILNTWGEQYTLDKEEFQKQTYAVIDYDDRGWDRRTAPSGKKTVVNPVSR